MMFYDILQKECFRDVLLFYVWLIWCKVADYKGGHQHFVLFVIVLSAIWMYHNGECRFVKCHYC